jgi:hypothetical protein
MKWHLALVLSLAFSCQVNAASNFSGFTPEVPPERMTTQQKTTAVQALVRSATNCVADAIRSNEKYTASLSDKDLNELIVVAMPTCSIAMHEMMNGYDKYFGPGMGEVFFTGPYLDVLPRAARRALPREQASAP